MNMFPHLFTPLGECGDEGMTLLNSCLFVKRAGLVWKLVANNSIDLSGSIEQVSSPAGPG